MIYMGKIGVGPYEFDYEEVEGEKGHVIRLYDGLDYVTEFQNKDEMKEYLMHAEPEKVKSEIDAIKKFRDKCWNFVDDGVRVEEIGDDDKAETQEAFMKRLAILRGGMSSKQFSAVVGINIGTMYGLLHGRRAPGMYLLKRIADECGVTVDWLLGG